MSWDCAPGAGARDGLLEGAHQACAGARPAGAREDGEVTEHGRLAPRWCAGLVFVALASQPVGIERRASAQEPQRQARARKQGDSAVHGQRGAPVAHHKASVRSGAHPCRQ
jgi:hypothetical protein